MKSKLLATAAAAAFSAAIAASAAFAQDDQIPKRHHQQDSSPAATQQEPANTMQAPHKKMKQSEQAPAGNQPAQADQNGAPAKKPMQNSEQTTKPDRNQAETNCPTDQEGNCQPAKTQKMGREQPGQGMKSKTNLGQQPQPGDQTQPNTKQMGQTPAKPDQTRTGQAKGGSSTDVDVTGSINVSQDRASRVHDRLIRSGERNNVDINVNVTVGQALPQRVQPRPLPPDIVTIVPEYRNYDYVLVRDEVVIVEPQTRKVVEVIRGGGGSGGGAMHANMAHGNIQLTAEQRQQILTYGRAHRASAPPPGFDIEEGASVPTQVELVPMEGDIVTEVPAIQSYSFFVDQDDQVVLVDPTTHDVVEVIDAQ